MNVLFVDDQISVLDGIEAGVHFDTLGIENVYYATSAKRAMEIIGQLIYYSLAFYRLFCRPPRLFD